MKEYLLSEVSNEILEQIKKGAFLTVKSGDKINTMTIGWGSLGCIWNRPVFTVLVRHSRYTYELIENAENFTVSFPKEGTLTDELRVCGTRSGRDIDKFKECNLTAQRGLTDNTFIIKECKIHFECKIVYKQEMNKNELSKDIKDKMYSDDDYHVMYFGEIIKIYED